MHCQTCFTGAPLLCIPSYGCTSLVYLFGTLVSELAGVDSICWGHPVTKANSTSERSTASAPGLYQADRVVGLDVVFVETNEHLLVATSCAAKNSWDTDYPTEEFDRLREKNKVAGTKKSLYVDTENFYCSSWSISAENILMLQI